MKKQNDLSWFRVVKQTLLHICELLLNDQLSKGDAIVYLLIKANANYETGISAVSNSYLMTKTGMSLSTVKRSVANLVEHKLLVRNEQPGRVNRYQLFEIVRIKNVDGNEQLARWPYRPGHESKTAKSLEQYACGAGPAPAYVQINNNINIQINIGTNKDKSSINDEDLSNIRKALADGLLPDRIKKQLLRSRPELVNEFDSLYPDHE